MNSFTSRLKSLFAFTLTTLVALTFCFGLSTAFSEYKSQVELNVGNITVKNVPDYSRDSERSDLGAINFDLFTDVAPLLNWNVRQIFLYLTAEYKTNDHEVNQVVVWDKIITHGDDMILDLKKYNTKYYFWDYGNGLKGNKNVTLTLSWSVLPYVGTHLKVKGSGSHKIEFPDQYSSGKL